MPEPSYAILLVPTDLSEPSLAAVRHAAVLARAFGSRVVLAYVMEDRLPAVFAGSGRAERDLVERHRERAGTTLAETAERLLPGVDVRCVVRAGVDWREIVALAREERAGLIVMGMHGHGFLVHALAGSTTERVLHHAPCPVLVVGQDQKPKRAARKS